MTELTIQLAREWLSGESETVACGYGPNGPNVHLKRPGGSMTLLEPHAVASYLLAVMQDNADLRSAMLEAHSLIKAGEIFEATAILKIVGQKEITNG